MTPPDDRELKGNHIMSNNLIQLPLTASGMLQLRKSKPSKNFNDKVEDAWLQAWENDADFRKMMLADQNAQSVEGSLEADEYAAAEIIRQLAAQSGVGLVEVATADLARIRRAVLVVRGRYPNMTLSSRNPRSRAAE
jgi:hypothetical protein